MPIKNREDAVEVEDRIKNFFDTEPDKRATELRALFVEVLDFNPEIGQVSLFGGPKDAELPASADRLASFDGVHVLYVALDSESTNRVRKTDASTAARLIADQLGDDLLLVFTNRDADQIHLILPTFEGARPTLRRMIIERDLPRRTAVQQVSNIYWNFQDGAGIRNALKEAFNVERVTDEFFREYKQVFDVTMEGVQGFGNDDDETERKKLFVQTLFNRLMFIYFLSRKGWLAFRGNKDYLNALWDDYRSAAGEKKNFYIDRLRLLFFAGLNNYRSEDLTSEPESRRLIGEPPFLNGGLFDMTDLDTRSNVIIPDECVSDILVKLFDRFNFTVMESTPFDIEVAVDPEMLGKVFEELVTGRHDSGSYYTPRPVVSFMCREALKGYLESQDLDLSNDAIVKFIDDHDTSGITLAAARNVGNALARITVVDPACGSGAYLLGMMQELVDLQTVLYNVGVDSKSLYELKLGIIQRNLYGVDIDEFAVNIAMLRLWLSLSIEYEGGKPEPLPNLDFKIVCGDSLLGPDPNPENYGDLFRHQVRTVADRLADLKDKHMRESGPEKVVLKEQITTVERELKAAVADSPSDPKAVDWRIRFAEVFNHGGFDIALANPPYIQLQRNGGELGNLYRNKGFNTFVRTGDIYQLFYERGCQILTRSQGLLAYITSNSWLKAEYGKSTRQYLADRHTPLRLLELGKDVFKSSAIVDSGVLVARTGGSGKEFPGVDMDRLSGEVVPPQERHWGRVRPDGVAPWSILSSVEHSILDKMRAVGTPLKEWDIAIYRGITTGLNNAFIIDNQTKEALVAEDAKSAEIIKPVLRGRDIQRYQAQWKQLWLIATFPALVLNIDDYPAVKRHLLSFGRQRLEQSGKRLPNGTRARKKTTNAWFEMQDTCAYHVEFTREKLFWADMATKGRFAFSDEEAYCNNKGYIMTGESLKYLCAVLNSSLITWWVQNMAATTGMGLTEWTIVTVERIPIPIVSHDRQLPFVQLVDRILQAGGSGMEEFMGLELQSDNLVYELYGLNAEEIRAATSK